MMRRISALLLCAFSASAFADDTAPLSSGRASQRPSNSQQKEVGIGIGIGPNYLGGDKTMGFIGPYAEANFGNGIFASTSDGIGYRFLEHPSGFSMAASLGPSRSRREKNGEDGDRNPLRGMGNINVRPQANLFLDYNNGPFHVGTVLRQTLDARRGTEVDVFGSYTLLASRNDLVRAAAGFSYANRSLMQTFFGVSDTQAANTGYAAYSPSAGIAGSGADVSWRHAFNKEWVGSLGVGVVNLRGSAADSPITAKRTSAVLGASIGYRF